MAPVRPRILVVDDSPTVRKMLERVLGGAGFEVVLIENGGEGLLEAQRVRPDAILTDFVMPAMRGHIFVKRLREVDALRDVPVVLISSRGEGIRQYFEDFCGPIHVLPKPFEPQVLVQLLARILGPTAAVDAPEEAARDALTSERGAPASLEKIEQRIDLLFRTHVREGLPSLLRSTIHDALREAGLLGRNDFTFAGSLERKSLPDLLNFLGGSGETGRLVLVGPHAVGEVYIEKGSFAGASVSRPGRGSFLGQLLADRAGGELDLAELDRALNDARVSDRRIGSVLLERKLITPEKLEDLLALQSLESLHSLLELMNGRFHFEADELPAFVRESSLRLPMLKVLMDGLRVLDEKHQAHALFEDEGVLIQRMVTNPVAMTELEVNEIERALLELVPDRAPLSRLIALSPLTALATKRVYYRLAKVGLVRALPVSEARPALAA
jgi:CheY-like chemotaxis protein